MISMTDMFFDMVYYINMDKDVDRNEHMIELLKRQGIQKYKRIPGVIVEGEIDTRNYRNFNKFEEKYVRGHLGSRASHLSAVIDAKMNNYHRILILEDDIVCLKSFNDLLLGNYNNIQEFDMLYFGGLQEQMFDNQIVVCHAYALSEGIYDDLINLCIPSGMEIDNFYAKILQHMSVNNRLGGKYIIKKVEPFNSIIQNQELFGSHMNNL
jgi:GR25 family glycosyltransferase involved in LPS biosynthesis